MLDDGRPRIELRTLTRLWLFSRHLYTLGEWRLWTPISHTLIKWCVLIGVPVYALLHTLHVPAVNFGLTLYVVVPGLMVWAALRIVAGGGSPRELVRSWRRMLWHCRPRRGTKRGPVAVRGVTSSPIYGEPVKVRGLARVPAAVRVRTNLRRGTTL